MKQRPASMSTIWATASSMPTNLSYPHAAPGGQPERAKNEGELTLIQIGDIHGHLLPRPNLRSDGKGRLEGGLARLFKKVEQIRLTHKNSLLFNVGDTLQGSAEALFTRGSALIEVLNLFDIDAFAPGNWDYVYGTERFLECFAGDLPLAPWNALAANLYYDGEPYAESSGQRVLPPYMIKHVAGIKLGILGFTTERGPKVVGEEVSQGFRFTRGDEEMKSLIPVLRDQERVDLLIAISELGLANNVRLAEKYPGVDVILSADMHEETRQPVVTGTGTIITELGQDGTRVAELRLVVQDGKISDWTYTFHVIDSDTEEDERIADKIAEIRKPFIQGPHFKEHINPINGAVLTRPIDTVVGYAAIDLQRSNFAHETMPAVIEGSSHDFLTDAFRAMTGAEIGLIRGFRYGTQIAAGPVKLEDIYHYIPIGPFIACGTITGAILKQVIENSADGSLHPDPSKWGGGWLFAWSALTFDLNPYEAKGRRARNIMVNDRPLEPARSYTVASYNYGAEPDLINKIPAQNVVRVTDTSGNPLDATEVVARYLEQHGPANPQLNRIRLIEPLPACLFDFPEVQPLQGAGRTS